MCVGSAETETDRRIAEKYAKRQKQRRAFLKTLQRISILIALIFSATAITLGGCTHFTGNTQTETSESTAFQALCDQSVIAKAYADQCLNHYLEPFDSDYRPVETAYGFVTGQNPVFLVRYKCSNGIGDIFYGYKIRISDGGECSIMEEGKNTAITLLE